MHSHHRPCARDASRRCLGPCGPLARHRAASQPGVRSRFTAWPRASSSLKPSSLPSPATLQIDAVGLESEDQHGALTMLKAMWSGKRPAAMGSKCLDHRSADPGGRLGTQRARRRPVAAAIRERSAERSRCRPARTRPSTASTRQRTGPTTTSRKREAWWIGSGMAPTRARSTRSTSRFMATAAILSAADLAKANAAFAAGSIVNLRATAKQQLQETGFSLAAPTEIEVYAVGEARQDGDFDSGWIINADTRQQIWKLTWTGSEPAGGAEKNRTCDLDEDAAGRSLRGVLRNRRLARSVGSGTRRRPTIPMAGACSIRVPDASARASRENLPLRTRPGGVDIPRVDGAGRQRGRRKRLHDRAADGRPHLRARRRTRGRMFDYGWIVGANHRRRVGDAIRGHRTGRRRFEEPAGRSRRAPRSQATTPSTSSPTAVTLG